MDSRSLSATVSLGKIRPKAVTHRGEWGYCGWTSATAEVTNPRLEGHIRCGAVLGLTEMTGDRFVDPLLEARRSQAGCFGEPDQFGDLERCRLALAKQAENGDIWGKSPFRQTEPVDQLIFSDRCDLKP